MGRPAGARPAALPAGGAPGGRRSAGATLTQWRRPHPRLSRRARPSAGSVAGGKIGNGRFLRGQRSFKPPVPRRARPAGARAAAATPAAAARGSTKREDKDSLTVASPAAIRRLARRREDKDSPTSLIFPRSTTPPRRPRRAKSTGAAWIRAAPPGLTAAAAAARAARHVRLLAARRWVHAARGHAGQVRDAAPSASSYAVGPPPGQRTSLMTSRTPPRARWKSVDQQLATRRCRTR